MSLTPKLSVSHFLIIFVADVGSVDGMVILHQHQGSQDSSDSGSLPPTYSRLPPDGHEFPEGQFPALSLNRTVVVLASSEILPCVFRLCGPVSGVPGPPGAGVPQQEELSLLHSEP